MLTVPVLFYYIGPQIHLAMKHHSLIQAAYVTHQYSATLCELYSLRVNIRKFTGSDDILFIYPTI